jgi:hypothetical protein
LRLRLHADPYDVSGGSCPGTPRCFVAAYFLFVCLLLCGLCPQQGAAEAAGERWQQPAQAPSASASSGAGTAGSQEEDKGGPVHPEHPLIVSEFSAVDVAPDGDLGKALWSGAKRVRFDEAAFVRTTYPESATTVASRWTAKYLYLAFWCDYRSLNIYEGEDPGPERLQLWEKDVVEAFINPEPARAALLRIRGGSEQSVGGSRNRFDAASIRQRPVEFRLSARDPGGCGSPYLDVGVADSHGLHHTDRATRGCGMENQLLPL